MVINTLPILRQSSSFSEVSESAVFCLHGYHYRVHIGYNIKHKSIVFTPEKGQLRAWSLACMHIPNRRTMLVFHKLLRMIDYHLLSLRRRSTLINEISQHVSSYTKLMKYTYICLRLGVQVCSERVRDCYFFINLFHHQPSNEYFSSNSTMLMSCDIQFSIYGYKIT